MSRPSRLARLQSALRKANLPALLVTSLPNVRYLTGFTGSAGSVFVHSRGAVFLTDFRYRLQADREVTACPVREYRDTFVGTIAGEVKAGGLRQIAFESSHMTYSRFRELSAGLRRVKLLPATGMVEELRIVKDPGEITLIRRAVKAAQGAYLTAARRLAGRRETGVALRLEEALRQEGAEGPAFPPIVASGPRGALPHASPGRRIIRSVDLVILDFGARWGGYHSDVTRTRLPGRGSKRGRSLYRLVARAQQEAIAAVRPGARACDVDAAARNVIEEAGYGGCFGHSTGHGVGLEVHERPVISHKSGERLAPGMVFTVEPGIYVEKFGGVRIEDMVLVTDRGCEILSRRVPRRDI